MKPPLGAEEPPGKTALGLVATVVKGRVRRVLGADTGTQMAIWIADFCKTQRQRVVGFST